MIWLNVHRACRYSIDRPPFAEMHNVTRHCIPPILSRMQHVQAALMPAPTWSSPSPRNAISGNAKTLPNTSNLKRMPKHLPYAHQPALKQSKDPATHALTSKLRHCWGTGAGRLPTCLCRPAATRLHIGTTLRYQRRHRTVECRRTHRRAGSLRNAAHVRGSSAPLSSSSLSPAHGKYPYQAESPSSAARAGAPLRGRARGITCLTTSNESFSDILKLAGMCSSISVCKREHVRN